MSRLKQERIVDPVLTELAAGYSNAAYVAARLYPEIEVDKEGFKIPLFTHESFKIRDTIRNINNSSNRILTDVPSTLDIVLDEHDLEAAMDYREGNEAIFELEKRNTFVVTEGVLLKQEKLASDLACDATKYASSNKITLSGSDKFSDPASDPVGIIENGKEAVRGKISRRPNIMVISPHQYKFLKEHKQLLEKIKYTETGIVTPEHMAKIFGIEEVVVGEAVYEDNGIVKDVWGKNIILAYVTKNKSMYEPTYGYTFRRKGMPQVDKYIENGGKIEIVRYTTVEKTALMGMDAGFLITEDEKVGKG